MELLSADVTHFKINNINFVVDITFGNDRRPSDERAFTIVKSAEFINYYISLSKVFRPRSILELGVFQGGGFVFLDNVLRPDAMSALELSVRPIAPLQEWIHNQPRRTVHYGYSQTDNCKLEQIVEEEFGGILDLVVDDASHRYEECRRSFEILFPLLSPGGYYIIEDWSWAHEARYQGAGAPLASNLALTNLIFDIVMLHGSTKYLEDVLITRLYAVCRKSLAPASLPSPFWDCIKTRGRTLSHI